MCWLACSCRPARLLYGSVTGDHGARFAEQIAFSPEVLPSLNSCRRLSKLSVSCCYSSGGARIWLGNRRLPSVHVGLITLNALFVWK